MKHKILLSELKESCQGKPEGYYEDAVSRGKIEKCDVLFIEDQDYRELVEKYRPAVKPVPYPQWPIWAKAIKQFSKPEDKGIGDVVARMIGDENSAAFKAFYLKVTGKTCGCAGRRSQWNKQFPL